MTGLQHYWDLLFEREALYIAEGRDGGDPLLQKEIVRMSLREQADLPISVMPAASEEACAQAEKRPASAP